MSLLIALSTLCAQLPVETITILTADKRELEASFYKNSSENKSPALLICPGQGYHRNLPLITEMAQMACKSGFNVLTIDWSYFTNKSKPSADLANESADLQAGIDYLVNNALCDTANLYLAGKSFGSVLAYDAFLNNSNLKALFLFTPLIRDQKSYKECYPDLKKQTRAISFIVGNNDSDNCPLDTLYKVASDFRSNVNMVVVGGDHGLNIGDYRDQKYIPLNNENINIAVSAAVLRLKVMSLKINK